MSVITAASGGLAKHGIMRFHGVYRLIRHRKTENDLVVLELLWPTVHVIAQALQSEKLDATNGEFCMFAVCFEWSSATFFVAR